MPGITTSRRTRSTGWLLIEIKRLGSAMADAHAVGRVAQEIRDVRAAFLSSSTTSIFVSAADPFFSESVMQASPERCERFSPVAYDVFRVLRRAAQMFFHVLPEKKQGHIRTRFFLPGQNRFCRHRRLRRQAHRCLKNFMTMTHLNLADRFSSDNQPAPRGSFFTLSWSVACSPAYRAL